MSKAAETPLPEAHIVTVGMSVFTNSGGGTYQEYPGRQEIRKSLDSARGNLRSSWPINPDASGYTGHHSNAVACSRAVDALAGLDHAREFGYRSTAPDPHSRPQDLMPQELSYLWKAAKERWGRDGMPLPEERSRVRFLCSDTAAARDCVTILRGVLEKEPFSRWYQAEGSIEADFAEGVNPVSGAGFGTRGVLNWMGKIKEMIDAFTEEGCPAIYLNVTGGYKGTVPYSTLVAMVSDRAASERRVQVSYLFEDSTEILPIPVYPIGLDFRQWHENALRLRVSLKHPELAEYLALDPAMKALLVPSISPPVLSPLGELLAMLYEQQLAEDPFKVYSRHIIGRLLDDAPELRDLLGDLITMSGDLIWIGDKLPEMVDHSQRHHHNLLEFTELFVSPLRACGAGIFDLNAPERFVLLSAVLLHDSGHVLDLLTVSSCVALERLFGSSNTGNCPPEIPLLPCDVRDYHQYLAALRLNDPVLARSLTWPGADGMPKGREYLHDAVLLTCLYHRRRMAFDAELEEKEIKKGSLHLTGQWPGPLQAHPRAREIRKKGVDLMKVVTLMRVIDGCDSQARRAGPQPRVDLTMALHERDYGTSVLRAQMARDAFDEGPVTGRHSDLRAALVATGETLPDIEKPQAQWQPAERWTLYDPFRTQRRWCYERLTTAEIEDEESARDERQTARLWLMAAEAFDRATVRHSQRPHYEKHLAVTGIDVIPGDGFGDSGYPFEVILRESDPARGMPETVRKEIEKEVFSEYDQVARYAVRELFFSVRYWWESAWKAHTSGDTTALPFYPIAPSEK